jgi:hypothetical protein
VKTHRIILLAGLAAYPAAALAQPFAITAFSVSCGGATTPAGAGPYTVACTVGDSLAAPTGTAGPYSLGSGFLAAAGGGPPPCYANCDGSTTPPILNVLDFSCFLNKFAAGDPYANCDASTTPPVLNVLDFSCFLNKFAAGCS